MLFNTALQLCYWFCFFAVRQPFFYVLQAIPLSFLFWQ